MSPETLRDERSGKAKARHPKTLYRSRVSGPVLRVWVRRLKTVFEPERFVGSPEGFCSAKGLLWAPGFRVLAEDGVVVFAKDFVPLMGL